MSSEWQSWNAHLLEACRLQHLADILRLEEVWRPWRRAILEQVVAAVRGRRSGCATHGPAAVPEDDAGGDAAAARGPAAVSEDDAGGKADTGEPKQLGAPRPPQGRDLLEARRR